LSTDANQKLCNGSDQLKRECDETVIAQRRVWAELVLSRGVAVIRTSGRFRASSDHRLTEDWMKVAPDAARGDKNRSKGAIRHEVKDRCRAISVAFA
jgi:hypothetical protein